MLDHAAPQPRQARAAAAAARSSGESTTRSSCRWVTLRPRSPPVGCVEDAEREGLVVVRQVAPDQVAAQAVAQQQAWRLERAARPAPPPSPARSSRVGGSGCCGQVEVAHAGGPPPGRVEHQLGHVGLGQDLAPARAQRPLQRRDRVALGVDRTAVATAEAAVDAGRPAVVGTAVDAGRRPVRVQSRRARRPRPTPAPSACRRPGGIGIRRAAPGGERVGAVLAGDAEQLLDRGVVGLQVVVLQRPVVDLRRRRSARGRCSRWKSSSRKRGSLASACTPPPPTVDGRLLTSPTISRSPSCGAAPVGAGLEQRVGAEQVPALGDLVVGEVAQRLVRRLQATPGGCGPSRPRSPTSPAAVSTSAAVAPPGPEPMTITSQSFIVGRPRRREQGLGEVDALPAGAVAVAAVGGIAVGGLARVHVDDPVVRRPRPSPAATRRRPRATRRCAAPRPAAPTARRRATAARPRPTRPAPPTDVRRVVVERAEQPLDVVERPGVDRARHGCVERPGDRGPRPPRRTRRSRVGPDELVDAGHVAVHLVGQRVDGGPHRPGAPDDLGGALDQRGVVQRLLRAWPRR